MTPFAVPYLFNFRNYSAAFARWTSADPLGFPDGPNRHFYAPVPTSQLDWGGCFVLKNPAPSPSSVDDIASGMSVNAIDAGKEGDYDDLKSLLQEHFPTWTFTYMTEELPGTLTISKYKPRITDRNGGSHPALDFVFDYTGYSATMSAQLKWIQIATKTQANGSQLGPIIDIVGGDTRPFYPNASNKLIDLPTMGDGQWASGVDFYASTYAAIWDGATGVKIYDGIYWGGYVE